MKLKMIVNFLFNFQTSSFGMAILILGGGAFLVMMVCFCIDLLMVYICCVAETPLKKYNEDQARSPSRKKKKQKNQINQIPINAKPEGTPL